MSDDPIPGAPINVALLVAIVVGIPLLLSASVVWLYLRNRRRRRGSIELIREDSGGMETEE
jgi:hypothetical protein